MAPVRIYIIDDHEIVRRGLRAFLTTSSDVEVVGDTGDSRLALIEIASLHARDGVDVVLTDLMMPAVGGFELLERVNGLSSPPRVVMLSAFGDLERVRRALDLGIAGYVMKSARPESILEAVRAAAEGRRYIDPALAVKLAYAATEPESPSLTPREREVVALVATGKSNLDIAGELFIGERTARTHVSHILRKLGLGSRVQLALWALDDGTARDPSRIDP